MVAPPLATQKTRDQAAALIQARARGHQQRQREHRTLRAVTALQARQRGRATRREFATLLAFYNEQASFLYESKRRRVRLWHREQELYFLQHTTTDELDAIRTFQYNRSARTIQRAWRTSHPPQLEDVDVSGLGRPFDPFGLGSSAWRAGVSDRNGHALEPPPPRTLVLHELFGELPQSIDDTTIDTHKAARRRAEIQERLKQRRRETTATPHPDRRTTHPTRRELYTELVTLRQRTAERLTQTHDAFRAARAQRDLDAAQLSASCRNRVAFLLEETRTATLLRSTKTKRTASLDSEKHALATSARDWSEARQRRAWHHHVSVVESVLGKQHWYETFVAGEKRDIRRVAAASPWDHERQVWQWPPVANANALANPNVSRRDTTPLTAMDRFRFCLPDNNDDESNQAHNNDDEAETTRPSLLDDTLASTWWRAHATQSHASYATRQAQRLAQLRRRTLLPTVASRTPDNNDAYHGSEDAHVTPEMLVNPVFYSFYQQTLARAQQTRVEQAATDRAAQLQHRVRQQVTQVETQIELNTQLLVEAKARVVQQKARESTEERAARTIQRVARGHAGRQRANDHVAEFFVLVRGRAIRKGKCEECGAQPAVLECRQCEESLHFCPVCWVHVHATRRRKTHVAIPMAVAAVAPAGAPQVESQALPQALPAQEQVRDRRPPPVRNTDRRGGESASTHRSTAALVLSPPRQADKTTTDSPDAMANVSELTVETAVARPHRDPRLRAREAPRQSPSVRSTAVSDEAAAPAGTVIEPKEPTESVSASREPPLRTRDALLREETAAREPVHTQQQDGGREELATIVNASAAPSGVRNVPTKATGTAKSSVREAATKPRMSLRQRMVTDKAPAATDVSVDASTPGHPIEPLAAKATAAIESHGTREPELMREAPAVVATEGSLAVAADGPAREQAARKIQSLRRRFLTTQQDKSATPNATS